eukprot:GFYU01012454.1.p1 GENE.GFYU01012454.1~~GFYU01012454.1.p1  ORF type:complete len:182 (+),score=33.84 GFYU01012454.1:31-576(+)
MTSTASAASAVNSVIPLLSLVFALIYGLLYMDLPTERTFAVIHPNAVQHKAEILNMISTHGYKIVAEETYSPMSRDLAEFVFVDQKQNSRYSELVASFTAKDANVVALCIEGPDVIAGWAYLMGPADPRKAKTDFPESIRARYGGDEVFNAVYGSADVAGADRELGKFFNLKSTVADHEEL